MQKLIRLLFFLLLSLISATKGQTLSMTPSSTPLTPCPDSPNCVCSEYQDVESHIDPIRFNGDPKRAWEKAKAVAIELGGVPTREEKNTIKFVYTSFLFHFHDDLEMRLEPKKELIQIRSASRTGYFDFGVNRRRVEKLRSRFRQAIAGI